MSPTTPASHDSLAAGASAANSSDKSQRAISRGKPSARGGWSGLPAHGVNGHDVADPSDRRCATRRRTRQQAICRHDTVVGRTFLAISFLGADQFQIAALDSGEFLRAVAVGLDQLAG